MASYMGHEYTPAPTQVVQGRYRVGDRVRVVKDGFAKGGSHHRAAIGEVTCIKEVVDEEFIIGDNGWEFYPHEIAPAFRPGDRVRLNRHSGIRACGDRGSVSSVLGDQVAVRMDHPSLFGALVAAFPDSVLDWERAEDAKPAVRPKPKFKAGDVVTNGWSENTIRCVKTHSAERFGGAPYTGELAYDYVDGGWDRESSLTLVTAAPCPQDNEQTSWRVTVDKDTGHVTGLSASPCIVALVKDGRPRPSQWPFVHPSVADATTEAERLARNNPGQEFAVYQRVAGRVAEVSYEMKEVA